MKPPMNTEQLSRNQKLGDSLRLRVFVVKTGPNPPRRREEREEFSISGKILSSMQRIFVRSPGSACILRAGS